MMVNTMNNNEIVAVDNSTAPSTTIAPLQTVDVQAASDFMDNYQELVDALLDETDYQQIGDKNAKKKSAWRKLATAFNISDEPVSKEIIRDECHRIISAHYEVKAMLPNGRTAYGVGSCSIWDKISKKDEREPTPFELRKRFTNAEHDIIGTAHTRAKSRAIADLIGAGEVSAEELDGAAMGKRNKGPRAKPKGPKSKPQKAPSKPKVENEVIEAEIVKDDTPSFKEICDSNPALTVVVQELQATGRTINSGTVGDKLIDFWDIGKVTDEEYQEAKKLLE